VTSLTNDGTVRQHSIRRNLNRNPYRLGNPSRARKHELLADYECRDAGLRFRATASSAHFRLELGSPGSAAYADCRGDSATEPSRRVRAHRAISMYKNLSFNALGAAWLLLYCASMAPAQALQLVHWGDLHGRCGSPSSKDTHYHIRRSGWVMEFAWTSGERRVTTGGGYQWRVRPSRMLSGYNCKCISYGSAIGLVFSVRASLRGPREPGYAPTTTRRPGNQAVVWA
jgi:hypothetical protein